MCTNLLFSNNVFKTAGGSLLGGSAAVKGGGGGVKSSIQQQQMSKAAQAQLVQMQLTVCNILFYIYENESSWPEIFVRAYIDDSMGERNWVDSTVCKEFVDNIRTAFATKPIPAHFSTVQPPPPTSSSANTATSHSVETTASDLACFKITDDEQQQISESLSMKKCQTQRRYASTKDQVRQLVIDLVKNYMSSSTVKTQPLVAIKRPSGSAVSTVAAAAAAAAAGSNQSIDNKNFIKLLQNICGIDAEMRAICLSKIDAWLLNPKLEPSAQDLLMAICVNSHDLNSASVENNSFIQQIIKIKPKLKQHQHYFECIRYIVYCN